MLLRFSVVCFYLLLSSFINECATIGLSIHLLMYIQIICGFSYYE